MLRWYAHWIDSWERRLASKDTNRVVRPFEWGLPWIGGDPRKPDPATYVKEYVRKAIACSEDFFSAPPPHDYRLHDNLLTFTSPLPSPHPENNVVHVDLFPSPRDRGRAVLVLPQWNAATQGHAALCRLLSRSGITALRMSMAYHDRRMPAELQRADYHVSSNIGRTIHASRQSVIDARACIEWLAHRGYHRLAILGTSLGSCIGFLAAAHEPRLRVGVFNHVSMYFGDVVWTGLSTRHVRLGFEGAITQDDLREFWAVISPATFLDRLVGRDFTSLLIWAPFDTTFLPQYSRQVVDGFRSRRLPHAEFRLPCAHYTTGQFPFSLLDALVMCRFLYKML